MRQSKFAVTGGIGSGKTVFCAILRGMGYPVYSCDEIYKTLLDDGEYLGELAARFPDCFRDGKLDKKALSRRVFANAEDYAALNALAHPRVMERLTSLGADEEVYFAEVPLLFEGGFEKFFDGVIAVRRDEEARISAVSARDGLSREEIVARIQRQFQGNYEDKNCVVVENDGSLEELRRRAVEALARLGLAGAGSGKTR